MVLDDGDHGVALAQQGGNPEAEWPLSETLTLSGTVSNTASGMTTQRLRRHTKKPSERWIFVGFVRRLAT
jgi:hypothetical protein